MHIFHGPVTNKNVFRDRTIAAVFNRLLSVKYITSLKSSNDGPMQKTNWRNQVQIRWVHDLLSSLVKEKLFKTIRASISHMDINATVNITTRIGKSDANLAEEEKLLQERVCSQNLPQACHSSTKLRTKTRLEPRSKNIAVTTNASKNSYTT